MKKIILSVLFIYTEAFGAQAQPPSHAGYTALLKKNVSTDGKVDYRGFIKDSVEFNKYLKDLSANPPNKTWSRNEQLAYWINAYNAFTIKLITMYYPLKSIKDIGSSIQIPFVNTPWDLKFINVGKDRLDLNNIEHGILRKRYKDPRIHMVLVCASKSCPVLLNEAYEAGKIEQQLTKQTETFLADNFRNKITPDDPQISMIFKWYSMDFDNGGNTVRDFVNRHSKIKLSPGAKIGYVEYDWSLNE
jgi:hypothetical protein